jgi:hypothetical protein
MKKQLTILFFFLISCTSVWSQGRYIKTTTPCDIELLKKTPGRWIPVGKGFKAKISKQQEQEILNRLNIIHQWVYNIYPSPIAFDAATTFSTNDIAFASRLKTERTQYGFHKSPEGGTPVIFYDYVTQFCNYFCGRDKYEIIRGAGCEGGTCVYVLCNSLSSIFLPLNLDDFYAEIMQIDERPIQIISEIKKEKWKGYNVYASGGGDIVVLLHREGMLPYIPVTRKQYLDRSIACLQRMFENNIKAVGNPEGLNLFMDKKERDEQIKRLEKNRDNILKYYRDELEATTNAGLLDSPAIVPGDVLEQRTDSPVFTTIENGGKQLVTENLAYIKKDLPKYVPQLIICILVYSDDSLGPEINPYRLYEQNFPIEKLQAMIDK